MFPLGGHGKSLVVSQELENIVIVTLTSAFSDIIKGATFLASDVESKGG